MSDFLYVLSTINFPMLVLCELFCSLQSNVHCQVDLRVEGGQVHVHRTRDARERNELASFAGFARDSTRGT